MEHRPSRTNLYWMRDTHSALYRSFAWLLRQGVKGPAGIRHVKEGESFMNRIQIAIRATLFAGALLGGPACTAIGQAAHKEPAQKSKKTVTDVKYKAHCGMIYSAADAKKYHYICPMDHKP